MTHSTVTVVLPRQPTDRDDLDAMLAELLAPFDENLEVEPYKDEDGEVSTYNPQSRWDWWLLGGRWQGYYRLIAEPNHPHYIGEPGVGGRMDPAGVDCCARGDIDTEAMIFATSDRLRESYREASKSENRVHADFIYGVDLSMTEDEHVAARLLASPPWQTFAILAEGVWREPGRMGWFGVDTSIEVTRDDYRDWFARFWSAMPGSTYVAVVDVHI